MSFNDELRVLNRIGARPLTDQECEQVPGAFIRTGRCTIVNPNCGTFDGDCEPPPC